MSDYEILELSGIDRELCEDDIVLFYDDERIGDDSFLDLLSKAAEILGFALVLDDSGDLVAERLP